MESIGLYSSYRWLMIIQGHMILFLSHPLYEKRLAMYFIVNTLFLYYLFKNPIVFSIVSLLSHKLLIFMFYRKLTTSLDRQSFILLSLLHEGDAIAMTTYTLISSLDNKFIFFLGLPQEHIFKKAKSILVIAKEKHYQNQRSLPLKELSLAII